MTNPSTSNTDTVECRFRLDNASSATFTLPDGRKLGYAQYGPLSGKTILYCHGLPGSRLEVASYEALAMKLNARFIAVDRPGYGWSSPHPDRKIIDHATDIECLANHLKLEKYGVMGISGGGPYALACASALPADKLKAVAIVCGLGSWDMSRTGMNWLHWLGFTVGWRYLPSLVCWWFSRDISAKLEFSDSKRFEVFKAQVEASAPKKDLEALTDDDLKLSLRSSREAFAQGLRDGCGQDGHIMNKDLGFRIEDIRKDLPVHLWYGTLDNFVPPGHGKEIARRLGEGATLHLKEETHWSILLNCREQILRDLVACI